MPVKRKVPWANVRIMEGLVEKLDAFLKTKRAQELALGSRSDAVTYAIRRLLEKEGIL
jgi:Arc/MetJ-type ribon-helix-helix transcriptional regulator